MKFKECTIERNPPTGPMALNSTSILIGIHDVTQSLPDAENIAFTRIALIRNENALTKNAH